MLEVNHGSTHDGSSGLAFGPVTVPFGANYSVLYVQAISTIATTCSFRFESAPESTGPWALEGSTSVTADANTGNSMDALRVTGPYPWMRVRFPTKSTGSFAIRLVAIGPV